MSNEVDVFLPSPWWPPLTYKCDRELPEGVRVSVPLRKTERIGFTWGGKASVAVEDRFLKLRSILGVIDENPCVTEDLWKLFGWLGNRLPFGMGHTLRIACPASLLKGHSVEARPCTTKRKRTPGQFFCYKPREGSRYDSYVEAIENMDGGGLVLFPDRESLSDFSARLPADIKAFSCIWPIGGGEKLWKSWLSVKSGEHRLVLGTSGAVFAPVSDLSLVIVEEESDPGHLMPAFPKISARTLAAKRASFSSASLVLGGTLPSARVAMMSSPAGNGTPKGRVSFVRPPDAPSTRNETLPFLQEIPFSPKLLQETWQVLGEGRNVLWILDRKGYAGELLCRDCGRTVNCRKCGGRPRWSLETASGECQACGAENPWPEECPSCRSKLIEIRHPGIEMSFRRIKDLYGKDADTVFLPEYASLGKKARNELFKKFRDRPSLILGTRSLISLCRNIDVGLVSWLDADTESWKPDYGARAEGFRIIWSSCWKGKDPDKRKILLQSRKPKKGWQVALEAGFGYFWENELLERKNLDLPPFCLLLEICGEGEKIAEIGETLSGEGFEVFPGPQGRGSLQVKFTDLEKMRGLLEPFFAVNSTSRGYPRISLDFE